MLLKIEHFHPGIVSFARSSCAPISGNADKCVCFVRKVEQSDNGGDRVRFGRMGILPAT
jgi:hypothetical protein